METLVKDDSCPSERELYSGDYITLLFIMVVNLKLAVYF